jgi:hypothetical protein
MRLGREQLPTETLDLDNVLGMLQVRVVVEERADLLPNLLVQVLANLAIKLVLQSGAERLATKTIY